MNRSFLQRIAVDSMAPQIHDDGYTQVRHIQGSHAQMFKRIDGDSLERIEIFPYEGGWIGLYPDGTWQYDDAPFAG